MNMRITKDNCVEVYDAEKQKKITKAFKNLKKVVEGETFIAILSHQGIIEVFDKKLNFISSQVIPDAKNIIANSRIVVQLTNGCYQFYDRTLKLQFSRQVA